MLTHKRVDVTRAGLAARIVALCALAVALLALSVRPAAAFQACPTAGLPSANISSWEVEWPPNPTVNPHGVAQCRAMLGAGNPVAVLQIVDLNDGAGISTTMTRHFGQTPPFFSADWLFDKHTVVDWFSGPQNPGAFDWFSTTNAAFFTTTSGTTTTVSLPAETYGEPGGGELSTAGYAWHQTDVAWDAPKRKLVLGPYWESPQRVQISSFPTHYTLADADAAFTGEDQGLVAYDPLYVPPGRGPTARRTMLGVNANGTKVYIVTTLLEMTLSQAQDILRSVGSTNEIQLDGGGSTSMFSYSGSVTALGNRPVPSVLLVGLGW